MSHRNNGQYSWLKLNWAKWWQSNRNGRLSNWSKRLEINWINIGGLETCISNSFHSFPYAKWAIHVLLYGDLWNRNGLAAAITTMLCSLSLLKFTFAIFYYSTQLLLSGIYQLVYLPLTFTLVNYFHYFIKFSHSKRSNGWMLCKNLCISFGKRFQSFGSILDSIHFWMNFDFFFLFYLNQCDWCRPGPVQRINKTIHEIRVANEDRKEKPWRDQL